MFDFFKNLRKSEAEKRQEAITAYLDEELTAGERQYFEQQMASSRSLREDVEQQRLIKLNISRLPQVRAPRNFTLDPALYGRPASQRSARLYPATRAATVLVGVFFVIAVAAEILTFDSGVSETLSQLAPVEQALEIAPAADMAMEAEAEMVMEEESGQSYGDPQVDLDRAEITLESELAAEKAIEEAAPMAAPAETLDEDMGEGLVESEESAVEESVLEEASPGEDASPVEESEQEIAPRATMVAEPPGEADAPLAAESETVASGGGESPEALQPELLMTEDAGRSTLAATETATSQPIGTVLDGESIPAPALADGEITAEDGAAEELIAEAPAAEDAGAEDAATDLGEAENQLTMPGQDEAVKTRESAAGLPFLRPLILLLGIGLILLTGMTLLTRWRMKK